MGTFTNKIKTFLMGEEASKIVVPTYYAEANIFPKTIKGVQHFPNYSTKTADAGMMKLYFNGLSKNEDDFIKNFIFKSQTPWFKNPMAILDPTKAEATVRTYVKMEDAVFGGINDQIRQMLKEAYGLHLSEEAEYTKFLAERNVSMVGMSALDAKQAAKKLWLRETAGLYKKFAFSFKGTFELKKDNDGAMAYIGTIQEVLEYSVESDTRKEPIFRTHPTAVVDPTEGQAAWFERFRVHPNKDVNLDVLEAAKKASAEMGITDMTIEGF